MSDNATPRSVAQGMARLKELLFDSEVETLSELDQRLSSIEGVNREQAQRLEQLFQRAGTEERFQSSIASVLDKALEEAELRNHDQMSRAMAPMVVQTIQAELRNSQDQLVDIMFPITGRMVKSYVAAEMKKLANNVNNRIDNNPTMLRVRSVVSGRPVSDLAIADSQRLAVDEVFLIRRGSGELVGHWPPNETAMSNADIHMSGVLAAINDFASSAFEDDGGHFDSFRYENFEVFMRASPVYLLAAKCNGVAPSGIESIFDDAFLSTMERIAELERTTASTGRNVDPKVRSLELHPLTETVEARTGAIYDDIARSSIGGAIVKAVLFLIAVPLLAWFFWGLYTDAEEGIVRRSAQQVIGNARAFEGYQPELTVGYRGKSLALTGFAPDKKGLSDLTAALGRELPNTKINARMAVIPTKRVEVAVAPAQIVEKIDTTELERRFSQRLLSMESQLIATAARRSVGRANVRLVQLLPELDRLESRLKDDAGQADIREIRAALQRTQQDVAVVGKKMSALGGNRDQLDEMIEPINKSTKAIAISIDTLASIHGSSGVTQAASKPAARTIVEASENLTSQAERIATLVIALNQTAAMIPEPVVVSKAPAMSADERLRIFLSQNAIFFSNGTEFVSSTLADQILDELAVLIKAASTLVRVVGYTDERGDSVRNLELAENRAGRVVEALQGRGVVRNRLVAVGRPSGIALSPGAGASSPNRRVQFEMGFRGEVRGPR